MNEYKKELSKLNAKFGKKYLVSVKELLAKYPEVESVSFFYDGESHWNDDGYSIYGFCSDSCECSYKGEEYRFDDSIKELEGFMDEFSELTNDVPEDVLDYLSVDVLTKINRDGKIVDE